MISRWNPVFVAFCLISVLFTATAHASDTPGTRLDCRNAKGNKVAANKNCNDAPQITTTALPNATEGQAYSVALTYTDTHNDPVTWRVVEVPQGMTITAQGVLQWQPGTDAAPSYAITLLVADDMLGSQASFTLTVNQADTENLAPVITSEPQAYLAENTPWTYSIVATDVDGDNLTYSFDSRLNPPAQPFSPPTGLMLTGSTLSWTPTYQQSGDYPITVYVSDGQAEVSQSFTLEVSNTNRAPVITSTPVTTGQENTAYTYIVQATDADNDALTYQLVAAPQGMTLVGNTLHWLPGYEQAGSHAITVEVSDGTAPVLQSYTLVIGNTNRQPEVTSSPTTSVSEGQDYTYTVEATDADGDALTYTLSKAPQGMTLSGQILSWQPGYAAAGNHDVTVEVSDGTETTEHAFTVAVANTNLPPVFTSTPVTSGAEGQAYSYALTATDGDGQPLGFELVNGPTGMTLAGNTLNWTPAYDQAGPHDVLVRVSDTEASAEQAFTITIDNTNRAPVFSSEPVTQVAEGGTYHYAFAATDADGDVITYTASTLPTGMTLEGNTLSWEPGYDAAGSYPITLSAADAESTTEQAFTLVVSNTNRAPQFTSAPVVVTAEGAAYAYALSAIDADGQSLAFALTMAPAGMALVNNTLVWQPGYEQAGSYPVTVTVTDGEDPVAQSFTLVVSNTNRAPEFISVPVTQVNENNPYSYTLQAIDPDGQFLSYSLTSAPAGMLMMLDTLQWQPDYQQAGEYTITVAATDGETTVEQSFTLTVANVNRTPVITSTPATTAINEMALYSYTPTATDDDGDTLTWQISGEPSGMVLQGSAVQWQPAYGQTGVYTYTLTVSDGKTTASQTATITVNMLDTDQDGVRDNTDDCADTPAGEAANAQGCALVQLDSDNDGVNDKIDQCGESPRFQAIAADGCSDDERDTDGDGVPDIEDASPTDPDNNPVPKVTIDSPANLSTLGVSPVQVTGTVDPTAQSLTLNGAPVSFDSSGHYQTQVTLEEGHNTIIARMVTTTGIVSTASVAVSLDKTPPYITIESHTEGQTVTTPTITVTGLINDIVRGTVESEQAYVTVNGQHATIANRSYAAFNVPLQPGVNTLTILAADQAGNLAEKQLTVIYQAPASLQKVEIIGGQNQTGAIATTLANPLSVKVLNAQGQPVANKPVVFRVIQGDGKVEANSDNPASGAIVRTNVEGVASTVLQLGQRSGVANNKVVVRVVDYPEQVFVASATPGAPDKLSVNSGNNQYGEVYQPLPAPFVVVATDSGSNVIQGVPVTFSVIKGGGHFGNGEKNITVTTDSDGRASAHLTAGGLQGFDAQIVDVRLADADGTEINAGFSLTAFQPGEPGNTTISGLVTDTEDTPLPGATVRVDGTTRQAVTGADGKFTLTEAPVGPVHLVVDGSTIEGDGEYPTLSYNIVTVSGVDNPLNAPVYMVKLNTASKQYAGLEDVAITLDEIPGFKLEIPAGSVTFPDGSKEGYVSVTVVNSSKVPMAPPNGMQPQFIVTIQPTGAMFEPPATLTIPNVDGHAPGRQVEMFSYDHDLEEFVAIGLGTVSKDGKTIRSNPGVGVVKAGWHCAAQPQGGGCAQNCAECATCKNNACQYDIENSDQALEVQNEGNCEKETCGGSVPDDSDKPEDEMEGDCRQPACNQQAWEPKDDATEEQKEDCRECKDGDLVDSCEEYAQNERKAASGITVCCKGKLVPYSYPPDGYTNDVSKTLIQGCTDLHEEYHVLDPTNKCAMSCGSDPIDDDPACGSPSQAREECVARQITVDCLTTAINNNDCGNDDDCLLELIKRRDDFNRTDNPELASCIDIENEFKCL